MLDPTTFDQYGKVVLLLLSVAGTAASGALNLFQFREKESLREEGRIALDDIIWNCRSLLAASTTEEEARKNFHAIRSRFIDLSYAQHRRDVSLRSDDITRLTKGSEDNGKPNLP